MNGLATSLRFSRQGDPPYPVPAGDRRLLGPVMLAAALLLCYGPVFAKLAARWDSPDDSYCALVPPLALYLGWRQRGAFAFGRLSPHAGGVLALAAALALTLLGELGSLETFLYGGLWAAVAASLVLLYGRRTVALGFPLAVLAFLVPLPPFVNQALTFRLKMAASALAVAGVRALGMAVHLEGNVLELGSQTLQVADACSGLRYVMPMALAGLLLGRWTTRGWWRVGLVFVLSVPVAVLVNAARVAGMALLSSWGHPEFVAGLTHDVAGWAVFLLGAALLALLARAARRLLPPPGGAAAGTAVLRRSGRPAGALLALALLLMGAQAWALRVLPSRSEAPGRVGFASFPLELGDWRGTREYLPRDVLDELWADDYVSARFTREGDGRAVNLLIPYYARQSTRHTAHAPQSCLLGGGWNLVSSEDRAVPLGGGRSLPVRSMLLDKGGARIVAEYFFLQRGRVVTSPWAQKLYLAWDAVTRRRTDGALVRAELEVAPGEDPREARRVLEGFVAAVWRVLPRYVPS